MLTRESFADLSFSEAFVISENGSSHVKKRRKPAGRPDPEAEVVALSPETLMESDHYVCEICNQGFQREQNLQMHRRRHKIPWKLLKGEAREPRKRVYICPEPSCLHHDPCHALGDLVGIKKHFRRKHSNHRQWVCQKCSKGYAVQSDYKAHLKTCGTKGHSCDCGRVFSRIDTFMEHQDVCTVSTKTAYTDLKPTTPVSVLQSLSPSSSSNIKNFCRSDLTMPWQKVPKLVHPGRNNQSNSLPSALNLTLVANSEECDATQLKLSIGSTTVGPEHEPKNPSLKLESLKRNFQERIVIEAPSLVVSGMRNDAREQLRIAMHEKTLAEKKRQQAKWQVELAEEEFKRAKQIRQQALAELNKAQVFKDLATKNNNSKILQITCHGCKKQFSKFANEAAYGENSTGLDYLTSVMIIRDTGKEKDCFNQWENPL